MPRKLDITNKRFGLLSAIEDTGTKDKTGNYLWRCICDCGNETSTPVNKLRSGNTKSCGCQKGSPKDIVGQRFGRLVAIEKTNKKSSNRSCIWKCICDCGNESFVTTNGLTGKDGTRSCGCGKRKMQTEDIVGSRFYELLVLSSQEGNTFDCLCDCGRNVSMSYESLVYGRKKSCGICKKIVNGRSTSSCVFDLCKLFDNPLHNHTLECRNKKINVDICLPKQKTVVEYDEWYWHKKHLDRDNLQTKYLLECGWSVLRIKANDNMPDFKQVLEIADSIKNRNKYEELVLNGWGA